MSLPADLPWRHLKFSADSLTEPNIGDGYLLGLDLIENRPENVNFQLRVMDLQLTVRSWDGVRMLLRFPHVERVFLDGFNRLNIIRNISLLAVDELTPETLKQFSNFSGLTSEQINETSAYWKDSKVIWLSAAAGVFGFALCNSEPHEWRYKIEYDLYDAAKKS